MNSEIKRCTQCILSSSFPKIEFDSEGKCSFCRDKMFFVSEEEHIEDARKKIKELFDINTGKSEYDAVMCYSGGKDSTYTLMLAVTKYKLKVLAFTLDNSFFPPATFGNINRVVGYLGVDLVTIKPSVHFIKSLVRAVTFNPVYNSKTLAGVSAICNSCISLVNISALRLALEKKIPFIVAGFTIGQIPYNSIIYKNNYRFLQDSREGLLKKLQDLIDDSVSRYFRIKDSIIETVDQYPYNINLLCLENISEEEIVKEVTAIGWIPPENIDGCSTNCLLNTFNNHVHLLSLGYNPYELELSHLIRKGLLTRNEALNKIEQQPAENINLVMEQLGISKEDMKSLSGLYNKK